MSIAKLGGYLAENTVIVKALPLLLSKTLVVLLVTYTTFQWNTMLVGST